jgi:uncharacterized membrane protein YphA (DoxX/SURF4 family)
MNEVLIVVLRIAASVLFLAAGVAKLMKAKPFVAQFRDFHLPPEIMYLVAFSEIVAVICLWIGPLEIWGYFSLGCLMLGAMKSHIVAKHSFGKLIPSLLLFGVCVAGVLYVNWLR